MEQELLALASSATGTLIGLMITDAWESTKDRWRTLLSRSKTEGVSLEEMEGVQAALVSAAETNDSRALAQIESELKARLLVGISADRKFAEELRALVGEYTTSNQAGKSGIAISDNQFSGPTAIQGSGIQSNSFGR